MMTRQHGPALTLTLILIAGCATPPPPELTASVPPPAIVINATPQQPVTHTPAATPTSTVSGPTPEAALPTATPTLWRGNFVSMEVPASGSYTLDPASGVVTLNNDFAVRDGPDLFVVLTTAGDVSLNYIDFSKVAAGAAILYLGKLQAVSGSQSYPIPPGTDLSPYRSVVVWCKQYSVAFAAALISP